MHEKERKDNDLSFEAYDITSLKTLKGYFATLPNLLDRLNDIFENEEIKKLVNDYEDMDYRNENENENENENDNENDNDDDDDSSYSKSESIQNLNYETKQKIKKEYKNNKDNH